MGREATEEVMVSFSGHAAGSGSVASSGPSSSVGSYTSWNWTLVGIVTALWTLFGLAVWLAPDILTDIWNWVLGLEIVGAMVVWTVTLPWMLGLAVLDSAWPGLAQMAAIAGLAIVSLAVVWPNRIR